MRVGSHVSIGGGYLNAAQRAAAMGGQAYQYFPKNPRSLLVKKYDEHDAAACSAFCTQHNIAAVAHAPYPTNLAIENPKTRSAVTESLINDLHIASACGSIGVVVHFGKYSGRDPLQGYRNILQLLNDVLSNWDGDAMILLENQAGRGEYLGNTLEEIVQIRKLCLKPDKIGFCFDTCHAYASGLWKPDQWLELEHKGMELGYFNHLMAIHLNDSKYSSESYRDRHAQIGQGFIGEKQFIGFLQSPVIKSKPIILETPETEGHAGEIAYVKQLMTLIT